MWKEQEAIMRPARPLLFSALLTAIVFAAFPLKLELSHFSPIRLQAVMQFEFLAKRYISSVLCIFLVLSAVLYLVIIRNSLRSNLLRHESMLAAYFGIYAIAAFAINMGWGGTPLVNHYTLSAATLCRIANQPVCRAGC
jgi:hypothetical protein